MADTEIRMIKAGDHEFEVATAGSGDRLALLLHGFPEHFHSWRHQMSVLADLGYTVWAPNLRGYGNSYMPKGRKNYIMSKLAGDVTRLIEAAEGEGLKKSPLLIAHDWGAVIGWYYAMTRPKPLQAYIAMNLPHPRRFREILQEKGNPQRRRSWYVLFFQIPWLPEFLLRRNNAAGIARAFTDSAVNKDRFLEEDIAVYRENALRKGGLTAMINYYRAGVRNGKPAQEALDNAPEKLDIPAALVWGEQDVALDITGTYDTEKWCEDLEVFRIRDASHWVQQDQPEKVNDILKDWLTRKGLAGA